MSQKSKNIIISYVMLIILLFPTSFFPERISNLRLVRNKYFISLLWSVPVFLQCGLIRRKMLLPIWLFLCAGGLATYLNSNAYTVYIQLFVTVFSSVVISYFYIKLRGYRGVQNITVLFAVFMIINTITQLTGGTVKLQTNNVGYSQYRVFFFLGIRVNVSILFIFSVILSLIIILTSISQIRAIAVTGIIASLYFIVAETVSTAIATFVIFIAVLILTRIIRSTKMWRNITIFIFIFALLFYFVSINSDIYAWFISGFLSEDITFNGRTYLWEQAISGMKGWHWLFGNGMRSTYFTIGETFSAYTAHSQYLNILYYFGLFGLAAYFYMMYNQFKAAYLISDQKIRSIMTAGNIAIIFMGIPTTTFNDGYMYIYYVIACMLPGLLPSRSMEAETSQIQGEI